MEARTDLRSIREVKPLSEESVRLLFDDIRERMGLPRRDKAALVERRALQREKLEHEGFPFATAADHLDI